MIVQIAVIHFQKHRRRMAYLAEQVDSLLKERQKTASEKVLKIWRHDSRGRRLAKTKVAAMTKRREVQVLDKIDRCILNKADSLMTFNLH